MYKNTAIHVVIPAYNEERFIGQVLSSLPGYVDKIIRGTEPRELPVQQPTRYELAINLKTAEALGLNLPQSLVTRADIVIE